MLGLLAGVLAACPPDTHTRLYHTEPIAPSLDEAGVRALDHLGPTLIDDGVNFGVFAGNAERVDLLLFDDPERSTPTRQFQMQRFGDVWNLYVEGIGVGQHYGYIAWGPNWRVHPDWYPGSIHGFVADVDEAGNRYNPNKLLLDPYARAVHRDHDWSRGSIASGPARTESTYAASAKSVVVESQYTWSEHEAAWLARRKDPKAPGNGWNEQVIYEVHVKGFTADPASGVEHPGTFRGFGEKAAYLKDLGVTAVHLMPIMEKPLDGGYWGYNTLDFFAPEISYASRTRPGEPLDEFKWMVDQLHQNGIEVWLDVVYNHTGEGGLWREKLEFSDVDLDPGTTGKLVNFDPKEVAGLYSYRGLDNASYYALDASDPGFYVNNTGVGNMTRCNYGPMRRLILDNLHYWVTEMHIDGFRFDLAPILGEKDRDYGGWDDVRRTVLQEIVDDPVLRAHHTRLVAEPWALSGFYLGQFPSSSEGGEVAWSEWNGHFRDVWRSFVNDDAWPLNGREGVVDIGAALTGSYELFGDDGRRPYHSVNFVTVHDGFTLYDLVTYEKKQNGCGPLNPACCDMENSPFCDRDSGEDHNRSRNWGDEALKRQMMRNFFTAILVSQGTPLLYAGDEWMRTQLGNNNAYSTRADNPFNWLQWGTYEASDERHRMHDFVRRLIAFRKAHAYAFAPVDYGQGAPFAWKSADNTDAPDWNSRHIAMHYYDPSFGPELEILINMEATAVRFQLPQGRSWRRVVDTQAWWDSETYLDESGSEPRSSHNIWAYEAAEVLAEPVYEVQPRSIVILEARTSAT